MAEYEKLGAGESPLEGAGADAVALTKAGTGMSERFAGGDQTQTQGQTGKGEMPHTGGGAKTTTRTRAGSGVAAFTGSGVRNRERQVTGRGTSAFTAGGDALIAVTTPLAVDTHGTQYPTFLVDGPCSNPYIENVTRGKSLRVWVDVPNGDTLTIDHNARRITLEGDMVWGYEGTFFEVGGSDVILSGAETAGAPADISIVTQKVDGLRRKHARGAGVLERTGGGASA